MAGEALPRPRGFINRPSIHTLSPSTLPPRRARSTACSTPTSAGAGAVTPVASSSATTLSPCPKRRRRRRRRRRAPLMRMTVRGPMAAWMTWGRRRMRSADGSRKRRRGPSTVARSQVVVPRGGRGREVARGTQDWLASHRGGSRSGGLPRRRRQRRWEDSVRCTRPRTRLPPRPSVGASRRPARQRRRWPSGRRCRAGHRPGGWEAAGR